MSHYSDFAHILSVFLGNARSRDTNPSVARNADVIVRHDNGRPHIRRIEYWLDVPCPCGWATTRTEASQTLGIDPRAAFRTTGTPSKPSTSVSSGRERSGRGWPSRRAD